MTNDISANNATVAPNSKVAVDPNLSHNIPATKLEGRVINPVKVATVPSAVAFSDGFAISEIYAFCDPSKIPI
jgi:hypothetical protein